VLSPDAEPRYGRFTLRTDCPGCGVQLPVNGPAIAVDCAACGERVTVPPDSLAELLHDFEALWPNPTRSGIWIRGDLTWRWTAAASETASCPRCEAMLTADDATPGTLRCRACETDIPTASVPCGFGDRVPTAALLIGVTTGEAPASRISPWTVRFDGKNVAVAERAHNAARETMKIDEAIRRTAMERAAQRRETKPEPAVEPDPSPGMATATDPGDDGPHPMVLRVAVAAVLVLLAAVAYAIST
jgi:ribosomal protein S27E